MKGKKEKRVISIYVQNEESATKVSHHVNSKSCEDLCPPASASRINSTCSSVRARKAVPRPQSAGRQSRSHNAGQWNRPHSAGALQEYSSVLKSSLPSAGSSKVPVSGHFKGRTGDITSDAVAEVSLARLKCGRRTFEGGPVSEERFWEMQAECYRLKRELADKEEQRKGLVARLKRAEDAVKRKLRASLEHISLLPKQKVTALTVLTQNYNTEKKIQELEERLRVGQKDTLKYLQCTRRYKAETEWIKRRLESTVRASRRVRSCTCQHTSKRYEKMVKDLRKQLSSLQKENSCLSHRFRIQSSALPDVSEYSTEDSNIGTELPSSYAEKSGSHYSQTKGCLLNLAHEGDSHTESNVVGHIEDSGGYDNMLQSSSDMVHSVEGKATESPLKECVEEQSIGDTLSTFDLTSQLMETWERLKMLTGQHNEAMEELSVLKVNNEHCVQKLQDVYRELSQERKKCLRLEAAEKRLILELTAAKHSEALLQQVRQQNVHLEMENAELVASALNVPRTNFSELKSLRQQLVDELKHRKFAEAKALKLTTQLEDCKQDLARLAVVEANWEYLKSELAEAKMAVGRADQKVSLGYRFSSDEEVHECLSGTRRTLQKKEMHLNGDISLSLEGKMENSSTALDNHNGMEDEESEKCQTSEEIDDDALHQQNKRQMSKCFAKQSRMAGKVSHSIAVKLCSSVPRLHSNHITMTILSLELNACTRLSSKKICVRFQFLAEFCDPDDQCTPPVPSNQAVLQYNYSRAFCVDESAHGDARECLKTMLDSEETAYVQFRVFGKGIEGTPSNLLGTCQVDLWAAMYEDNPTDRLETQLEVISGSSKPVCIGKLEVVVHGLELLRDIHGLTMPSSPVTPCLREKQGLRVQ